MLFRRCRHYLMLRHVFIFADTMLLRFFFFFLFLRIDVYAITLLFSLCYCFDATCAFYVTAIDALRHCHHIELFDIAA